MVTRKRKTKVMDVAAYILQQAGPMTHMKLQKLVYYAQAWSLVWDEAPLFDDRIEAWANGPVVPVLYRQLRQKFQVESVDLEGHGNAGILTPAQRESVEAVLKFYGSRTAQYLSDLTHIEAPWKNARNGAAPQDRTSREITHAEMAEYYGSLQ